MIQYEDIFKPRKRNLSPQKGYLLIAEPFMSGAYFSRSVIILIEHGNQGSMGMVLNKRTSLFINDFFAGMEDMSSIPVYLGGPVATDHLYFIHSLGDIIPDCVKITEDLYFGGDFESIIYYILNGNPVDGMLRFFLGYSGWSENQLSDEIKDDSWLVGKPIPSSLIMQAEGEMFWKSTVESVGGIYKAWVNFPKHVILN